jgi:hypothetical protein
MAVTIMWRQTLQTATITAITRWVGSMGIIKFRISQLDLGVLLSQHPAPDILRLLFCSCENNRDKIHELLLDYLASNYDDFRLYDVDVLSVLPRI